MHDSLDAVDLDQGELWFSARHKQFVTIEEKGIIVKFQYPTYHLCRAWEMEAFFTGNPQFAAYHPRVCTLADDETTDYLVREPVKLLDWGIYPGNLNIIHIFEGTVSDRIYLYPATAIAEDVGHVVSIARTSRFFIETEEARKELIEEVARERLAEERQGHRRGGITYAGR